MNMFPNPNLILLDRLRRQDMERQARQERLAAYARGDVRSSFLRPVVRWIGRRLVSLGLRLLVFTRGWDHRLNTVYNSAESLT
jgi:hypothetical protein